MIGFTTTLDFQWRSFVNPAAYMYLLMVYTCCVLGHFWVQWHYNDVIMSAVASQITSVSIVCSTVGSSADQRKHQSSTSLAFVWGIHRWPVNSPHKGPVTRNMFPFDDVIMMTKSRFRVSVGPTLERCNAWITTYIRSAILMMTSSDGNIFRVTGHLCGEFTGHRWIPRKKASDAELWCGLVVLLSRLGIRILLLSHA